METKKQYIAPALTVVTFKTERGYATSIQQSSYQSTSLLDMFIPFGAGSIDGYNDQAQQNWTESNDDLFSW